MANRKKVVGDPVLAQLEAIKRLLALQLLQRGAQQSDLAIALQTDQSEISRMLPTRQLSFSKPAKK